MRSGWWLSWCTRPTRGSEGCIERRVYGYRSDPAVALRRLSASVELSDPLHIVDTIMRSVGEALRIDDVWVEFAGQDPRVEDHVVRVPLVHRGERVGHLAVEGASWP